MPSPERFPYRKIIVGYDGSEGAQDALTLGHVLQGTTGAELVLTHVTQHDAFLEALEGMGGEPAQLRDEYLLTQTGGDAREVGEVAERVGAKLETVASVSVARGLQDLADQIDTDLIVIGSSRHGTVGRVFAGSVGERLLHGSPCAVAVAPQGFRDREQPTDRVVAVGYDSSPESKAALHYTVELAGSIAAKVRVVSVVRRLAPAPGSARLDSIRRTYAREQLERALQSIPETLEPTGELISGDPASSLAEQSHVDLIVVGSRGYGPLRRVLLGGVSARLIRAAPYPVLLVPRGAENGS